MYENVEIKLRVDTQVGYAFWYKNRYISRITLLRIF